MCSAASTVNAGLMRSPAFSLAYWLASILINLVTGQIPSASQFEPEFLEPLKNFTITLGRDVHFTCVVSHLSNHRVAWIKSDSKAILAMHTRMVAINQRLSVTYNGYNTWKLHISNVQANDSGTYMCQINTDPMKSQMGHLAVVIPPDIIDEADGQVAGGAGPGGGAVAREGGTVRLRCAATGEPPPNVSWRRESGRHIVFRHKEKKQLLSFDGPLLQLTHVSRADMGAYYCIASNGVPPTVRKRYDVQVQFHPLIKVSNQLVAAPISSDVIIQCYVEAFPKAMNSWYKENGEKLLDSSKYVISETPTNEYSLYMNLTIRSLDRADFGGYLCSAANALGKVEGAVRLQELQLAAKSHVTAAIPRQIELPKTHNTKSPDLKYKHKSRKEPHQHQKHRYRNNIDSTTDRAAWHTSTEEDTSYWPSESPSWYSLNNAANIRFSYMSVLYFICANLLVMFI